MNNNLIKTILERELEQKDLIFPFISGLSQREKAILSLREQGKALSEIGRKLKLTRERIRQIEAKANAKLEYQKEIIEKLAQCLGEYLFTEEEVEKAFFKFSVPNKWGYATIKLKWQDFSRQLWIKKSKENAKRNI